MKVKSDMPCANGGWLHKLDGLALPTPARVAPRKPRLTDTALHNRFAPLTRNWFAGHGGHGSKVEALADALGVAPWTLDALRIGWDGHAWTCPERNHNGLTIGITRRLQDGSKMCIVGSRRGLTYRDEWQDDPGPVLLVEGASDVAAGLTMGLCVVGRPSNCGGAAYLVGLLRSFSRQIVVMGENDEKHDGSWPGAHGAHRIADVLRKRLLGRSIVIRFPPIRDKDLRSWFNARGIDPDNREACVKLGQSFTRLLGIKP